MGILSEATDGHNANVSVRNIQKQHQNISHSFFDITYISFIRFDASKTVFLK